MDIIYTWMRNVPKSHTIKLCETPAAGSVQWEEDWPSEDTANKRDNNKYFQKSKE